ncbi:hypothetical protein Q31a_09430 [Aureliella helgolandensis]|uniref:Uncharacterized protein n=1 Tax=Aureliella helgolandensis TaxID=2527968 RepID=A0A518G210_9BACT|nr:hypothetical protein Q31a_09430 [Aureliella helgolandensis]
MDSLTSQAGRRDRAASTETLEMGCRVLQYESDSK